VDANQVATLRALLAPTGWLDRTRAFARGLRQATRTPGGLLLVGTPAEEPWHLTAHLDEESRLSGIPEMMPTLVRWQVPDGAPPHLRVGLERLRAARRGETVFVVTPSTAPVPLLERVSDARKVGATIFALDQGDPELERLAHEALSIAPGPGVPGVSFGAAQHLISAACGELGGDRSAAADRGATADRGAPGEEFGVASQLHGVTEGQAAGQEGRGGRPGTPGYQRYRPGVRGLRDRVAHLLDVVSGPNP
jgi:hypothetical protein